MDVLIKTEVGRLNEGDFFYMKYYKKPFVLDYFEDKWVVCSNILSRNRKIRLLKTNTVYV